MSTLNVPVEFLEWDSQFFEKRIGRVVTSNMTQDESLIIDDWAKENQIDCLYYLAEGKYQESSYVAEERGFHLVDLRVSLQLDLQTSKLIKPETSQIRMAREDDLDAIKAMASDNHQISRFFADRHFDRKKCQELYATWLERDFQDQNHFLWVWEEEGKPIAYMSAKWNPDDRSGDNGLEGVLPQWRGRGIGKALQLWFLNHFKELGINKVNLVTQGRNIVAQNTFQHLGYRLMSIDLWYHKWYTNPK